MRERLATALTGLLTLVVGPGSPAADMERRSPANFHLRAAVADDGLAAGGAYAIPLSDAAVSTLAASAEIRLFDADGQEIPSTVDTAAPHVEVVERPARVFNEAWDEEGGQTFSLELTGSKPDVVDHFAIGIAAPDYHVEARVEGSDDGEQWRILADRQHLLRHSVQERDVDFVHDVLVVPRSSFRYYRFTLTRRTPRPLREPLEITGVKVRDTVWRDAPSPVPVALASFDDPEDADERHDYWRLDLGREGLGVNRVSLRLPGDGFARSASLWEWSPERGRRTRRLATTVVFRYGEEAHEDFDGFATDAGTLVVMIDQGDDEPVRVSDAGASRPTRTLRFLAPGTLHTPLALHFEPDRPREPIYDLDRRLRENEIASFAELRHGELEPNPDYREAVPPRSEQLPYLLYALVVPLVLGLGWYVVRSVRRGL